MDVIVGFGPIHDRLIAAALRGCGADARAAGPLDREAFELGRALLAKGYAHSSCYLVGAMARFARTNAGESLRFVTPGDRCALSASQMQRALDADGARAAGAATSVLALVPEELDASLFEKLRTTWERACVPLIDAVTAGDVLLTVSARMRSSGRDPRTTDARVASTLTAVEHALEQSRPASSALVRRRSSLKPRRATVGPRARVRVTGDWLTTMYDQSVGAGLVRWMESRSVRVDPPLLTEWILYTAFRASLRQDLFHALRTSMLRSLARNSDALASAPVTVIDPTEWLDEAERWMPLSLCSGSGFVEIATYLAVDRDHRADLVLSLKPWSSITSSAISDAVLRTIARERRTSFVALEINGDQPSQLESRVELAVDALVFADRSSR